MKKILLFLTVLILANLFVLAQEKWIVPKDEAEKISIRMFNDDMVNEGRIIYENTCQSCHGTPGEGNFTLMSPSPGDPASEKFQSQKDGEIFYKIKHGRNAMPGFGHLFSDFEFFLSGSWFCSCFSSLGSSVQLTQLH